MLCLYFGLKLKIQPHKEENSSQTILRHLKKATICHTIISNEAKANFIAQVKWNYFNILQKEFL